MVLGISNAVKLAHVQKPVFEEIVSEEEEQSLQSSPQNKLNQSSRAVAVVVPTESDEQVNNVALPTVQFDPTIKATES